MKERPIYTYESKVANATVTVIGKLDCAAWARKTKQILDDLEAGRYEEEEAV